MPREPQLQVTPDVVPLRRENAVHHRVADRAILPRGVVAEHPVLLRAETFDRTLRPEIEIVRAQTDDFATEGFERVPEEKEFAGGIDVRALTALRVPRVADLHAIEDCDDVVIASGA